MSICTQMASIQMQCPLSALYTLTRATVIATCSYNIFTHYIAIHDNEKVCLFNRVHTRQLSTMTHH